MGQSNAAIAPVIEYLQNSAREGIGASDVIALTRLMAAAVNDEVARESETLHREFRDIVDHIDVMKEEIARLQAGEVTRNRIPSAGEELQSVVASTEQATHQIMETAEAIMGEAPETPDEYRAFVEEKLITVFEACAFQDLAGQRIAKVVETLQFIETRLSRFAAHFDVADAEGHADEAEKSRAERKEDLILHGPSAGGVSQSDIDALFD
ncbi:MAG: hypothetical protein AB7L41_00060 [Flavobacteriaceae bacterium]